MVEKSQTALRLGTLAQRLLLRQSAIGIIWYCRAPQTFFSVQATTQNFLRFR